MTDHLHLSSTEAIRVRRANAGWNRTIWWPMKAMMPTVTRKGEGPPY